MRRRKKSSKNVIDINIKFKYVLDSSVSGSIES